MQDNIQARDNKVISGSVRPFVRKYLRKHTKAKKTSRHDFSNRWLLLISIYLLDKGIGYRDLPYPHEDTIDPISQYLLRGTRTLVASNKSCSWTALLSFVCHKHKREEFIEHFRKPYIQKAPLYTAPHIEVSLHCTSASILVNFPQ